MMGLDRIKDDCVLLIWAIEADAPEISTTVGFPALESAVDEIEAYAVSVGMRNSAI
ncbi:hypothetical protein BJX99DRAFT_229641 [Aspergillus californicus]